MNYAILSMMRSGHHAIIEWIANGVSGEILFHNNYTYEDIEIRYNQELPAQPLTLIFGFEDEPVVRFNIEIKKLKDIYKRDFKPIIIIRNPFNTFASRFMHKSASIAVNNHVVDLWVGHAREILNETSIIQNVLGIYFDLWFESDKYRKLLTRKLNIRYSRSPFLKVPFYGGGSSFDGHLFDGNAKQMDVLNRWIYIKDVLFKKMIVENQRLNCYYNLLEKFNWIDYED